MQFPDTPATRLTNQVMMRYRELNPEVTTSEFNTTFSKLWEALNTVPETGGEIQSDQLPEEIRETFTLIVQENHDRMMLDDIRRTPRVPKRFKVRRVVVNGKPTLVQVPKGPRHTPPKKRRK